MGDLKLRLDNFILTATNLTDIYQRYKILKAKINPENKVLSHQIQPLEEQLNTNMSWMQDNSERRADLLQECQDNFETYKNDDEFFALFQRFLKTPYPIASGQGIQFINIIDPAKKSKKQKKRRQCHLSQRQHRQWRK